MKILVTGADGFVGRWMIRRLLADGHEVFGALRPTRASHDDGLADAEREAVRWLPLELTDAESVRMAVDLPYGAVIHLAAVASGPEAARDPGYASRVLEYAQKMQSWRLHHADRTLTGWSASPDGLVDRSAA